jgi:Trk K+ transport system NAD-binding subunit
VNNLVILGKGELGLTVACNLTKRAYNINLRIEFMSDELLASA